MPLEALPIRPGLVLDDTDLAASPYASATDRIIWRDGHPQVMAGWKQARAGLIGVCRACHEWTDNRGRPFLALGTDKKLYIYSGDGVVVDVTPKRTAASLPTNPVTTTAGSRTVAVALTGHGAALGDGLYLHGTTTVGGLELAGLAGTLAASAFQASFDSPVLVVTHAAHGLANNDLVFFASATGFAGIPAGDINTAEGLRVQVLNATQYKVQVATKATATTAGGGTPTFTYAKFYQVTGVTNSGAFTIESPIQAFSSATGGGASGKVVFDLVSGFPDNLPQQGGFGADLFGAGLYGVSEGNYIPEPRPPRYWSLDNWGQELIAAVVGGGVYRWNGNVSNRAVLIAAAPAKVNAIRVTAERFLLALGCTGADAVFDPLLVRSSDLEDLEDWTPAADNSARSFRLGQGSAIVGSVNGRGGILLWTDTSLYGLRYVGRSDQVYRADPLGDGCGLLAINAAVAVDGDAYWLSPTLIFYSYRGGRPAPLPCPIQRWTQENLEPGQAIKTFAGYDHIHPAVFWFAPTFSDECDTLIRLDLPEAERDGRAGWSTSVLPRTAWCPGRVFPGRRPLATHPAGVLYQHDTGNDADGEPLEWLVRWAPLLAEDGHRLVSISRLVVDAVRSEEFTVRYLARLWTEATPWVREATYPLGAYRLDLRVQGREIIVEFTGSTRSVVKFGTVRADATTTSLR